MDLTISPEEAFNQALQDPYYTTLQDLDDAKEYLDDAKENIKNFNSHDAEDNLSDVYFNNLQWDETATYVDIGYTEGLGGWWILADTFISNVENVKSTIYSSKKAIELSSSAIIASSSVKPDVLDEDDLEKANKVICEANIALRIGISLFNKIQEILKEYNIEITEDFEIVSL